MPVANPPANRLLKPEVLATLGSLELVARTVVDGVTIGLHRSPNFGFSQEFAEYRTYNDGDDLRHVDWNVYARTERMYVKRYEGETNTAITLLLDSSASMNYGAPVSKIEQAKFLAATLAYTAHKQHDALGLAIFDEQLKHFLAPSSRPDSLSRALGLLERVEALEGTDILAALAHLQPLVRRRGLVIVISDFYADPEELFSALQPLSHSGQDLALFHILDPEEIEPSLEKISAMRDLETGETVTVAPTFLQTAYRSKFNSHCDAIADGSRRIGASYTRILSSDPLDEALQGYLRLREHRRR